MDFMLIQSYLEKLPSLEDLHALPKIKGFIKKFGKVAVDEIINRLLDERHLFISTSKSETPVKKIDFSMDYYVNEISEELGKEKDSSIKKIINCMGTIYSEPLGSKIYSKELLKDFTEIYSSYNNLRYNLDKGLSIDIENEIEKMLKNYSDKADYLLFSNFSGALYSILNSCYKDCKVISSVRESYSFEKDLDVNKLVKSIGASSTIVGSLNKVSIEDYNDAYDEESLIILSDFYGNGLEGLAKLKEEELNELLTKEKTLFLSDKFYLSSKNSEIISGGLELSKYLNHKSIVIADLSKNEDIPACIIVAGSKEHIKKIRDSVFSKMFYLSKEIEVLLYLSLFKKISESKNNSYLDLVLQMDEAKLKKRNVKFADDLQNALGESCEVGLLEGPYLKIEENISYKDAFNRELIVVTPKEIEIGTVEKSLREAEPAVLCWINEGSLLVNLQLVDKKDEKILLEILTESIKK